jgi:hypothetical protein
LDGKAAAVGETIIILLALGEEFSLDVGERAQRLRSREVSDAASQTGVGVDLELEQPSLLPQQREITGSSSQQDEEDSNVVGGGGEEEENAWLNIGGGPLLVTTISCRSPQTSSFDDGCSSFIIITSSLLRENC